MIEDRGKPPRLGSIAACELMQEQLSEVFTRFAQDEFHNSSPLYRQLSLAIANDPELLSLAAHSRPGERVPNLFFAAVHFLLLKGVQHPVSRFYKSLCGSVTAENPYPDFRAFCTDHAEDIRGLISNRMVQTNEVSRCAVLLPAFVVVSRRAAGRPLYLVELGASAGLNLLWDRYGYRYGETANCGNMNSPVQIKCAVRGQQVPPLPDGFPRIAARVGVDLNPIDVRDPEAVLWLHALIWPEHGTRARLFERAVEIAKQETLTMIGGDGVECLPALLESVPDDVALCLLRMFTSLPSQSRARLSSLIAEYGAKRDAFFMASRPHGKDDSELRLVSYIDGVKTEKCLAHFHNHGGWIEWLEGE